MAPAAQEARIDVDRLDDRTVALNLRGRWLSGEHSPTRPAFDALFGRDQPRRVVVRAGQVSAWDSALVAFLLRLREMLAARGIEVDLAEVPAGAARLLALATAVPKRVQAQEPPRGSLPARIGETAMAEYRRSVAVLDVLGQACVALYAFVRGKARYRREDLVQVIRETGIDALPIVGLISLLIGLILAFIGAVQLQKFGAAIYVADLVGLAVAREMAAVMTAIVMAGRTGAAFAAQIGSMQGSEEVDALATFGISPVEFLMVPRIVALSLMMPLLFIHGCCLGLFGGWLVAVGMLDLTSAAYIHEMQLAVRLSDFGIGLGKSVVFGIAVAFTGCLKGMQAGRSAAAVGQAATSAVVTAIVYIVALDALFAVLCNVLGI